MSWKPIKYLDLELNHLLNKVRLPGGNFDSRLSAVRARVNFTPDISLSNFIQYDSVSETVGLNSRLRWEFRPGAIGYLVLNQSYERENCGVTAEETILSAKISVTFRF